MAIGPKKTSGKTISGRKQKRRPRRLVEAAEQDWQRWDAACEALGLNFSEFARRALDFYALTQTKTKGPLFVGPSIRVNGTR